MLLDCIDFIDKVVNDYKMHQTICLKDLPYKNDGNKLVYKLDRGWTAQVYLFERMNDCSYVQIQYIDPLEKILFCCPHKYCSYTPLICCYCYILEIIDDILLVSYDSMCFICRRQYGDIKVGGKLYLFTIITRLHISSY